MVQINSRGFRAIDVKINMKVSTFIQFKYDTAAAVSPCNSIPIHNVRDR